MDRDDYDSDDVRTTRSSRRPTQPIDPLDAGDSGSTAASDRNWRADRGARRRSRSASFPASRQEFALWLQYGGWRVISIAAAVVIVLVLGMVFLRGLNRAPLALATPTAASVGFNQPPLVPQATVTPVVSPTASIAAQGSGGGAASDGAKLRVTGTGAEGLFLRPNHNTDSEPIKTLPEGTVVTVIGEDFSGPDRVWKHVRDPEGTEGWAAADFLKPGQ